MFDIGSASSISTRSPYLIPLESGWNQIGDPFSFPVARDGIGNSQLILTRPQRWNSEIENYEINQQILNPWEGYWVFNNNKPINLSVNPIAAKIPVPKNSTQEGLSNNEFLIQIKAYSSSNVQDPSNFIGMMKSDKLKAHDILEPLQYPINSNLVSFPMEKNLHKKLFPPQRRSFLGY